MPNLHFKKIILLIIGLIVVVATVAFIFWKYFFKSPPASASPIKTFVSKNSPTPNYPKVSSWQVPILMYHYIRDASNESEMGKNLSVHPDNFDRQMLWLKNNNYKTLTVADLTDPEKKALSQTIGEGKKPIIITFDDGYKDAYTQARPVLKKYQMTATFYIIQDYIGRSEYMNQQQINTLKDEGFEIGSHTLSHPNLTKISREEAQRQIRDSKNNTTTFCYPAGKYNEETVSLLQEAGYLAAVTTHFGIADENSKMLELPRVRVEDGSGEQLGDKISAAF